MATFLIGGIWHGAGWTFVIWGFLHGLAMILHRLWKKTEIVMPRWLAWFLTFNFINFTWIFFRAKNFDEALNIIRGMLGMNGLVLPRITGSILGFLKDYGVKFDGPQLNISLIYIPIFIILSILFKNSNQIVNSFTPATRNIAATVFLFVVSIITLSAVKSEFIYFNF